MLQKLLWLLFTLLCLQIVVSLGVVATVWDHKEPPTLKQLVPVSQRQRTQVHQPEVDRGAGSQPESTSFIQQPASARGAGLPAVPIERGFLLCFQPELVEQYPRSISKPDVVLLIRIGHIVRG